MYSWIGMCVFRFLFVPRKLLYLHILMPRLLELIFYLCLLQKTWLNIPRKISFLQPKLFSTRNTAVHTIWILLQHLMILLQNYYKLGGLKGEFTLLHHLFTVNIWKQWPQKEIVKGKLGIILVCNLWCTVFIFLNVCWLNLIQVTNSCSSSTFQATTMSEL